VAQPPIYRSKTDISVSGALSDRFYVGTNGAIGDDGFIRGEKRC
jgi:hypothetical protein